MRLRTLDRRRAGARWAKAALVAACLAGATAASAQTGTVNQQTDGVEESPAERRERQDFEYGWVGILGLAGLLGARRARRAARDNMP